MHKHKLQFIEAMKALLEAERAKLRPDNTQSANFPNYGRNEEDNATEIADYVAASATTDAKEARVREIEAALERIKEGKYGFTAQGELIPEKRLRANPAATTLVS